MHNSANIEMSLWDPHKHAEAGARWGHAGVKEHVLEEEEEEINGVMFGGEDFFSRQFMERNAWLVFLL